MKTPRIPLHIILRQAHDETHTTTYTDFAIAVYDHLKPLVQRIAANYCPSEAEDLTQDFFMDKLLHRKSYDAFPDQSEAHLKNYILKMVRYYCLSKIKAKARKPITKYLEIRSNAFTEPIVNSDPGPQMDFEEALGQLSEMQSTAFHLSVVKGLSQEEMCSEMDASVSSVKNLLHRARKKILLYLL